MKIHACRGVFAATLAAVSSWSFAAGAEEPPPEAAAIEPSEHELHEHDELHPHGEDHSADPELSTVHGEDGHAPAKTLSFDVGVILDVAGAWFSEEPMQLGEHDPDHTGFNFQQLEMEIGGAVDGHLRLDSNIVFTLHGVEIEEAYATTLGLPGGLQLRAGQFLMPFGRLNPTHPHEWLFLDRTLVNGKFLGPEGSRNVGGEVSWRTPLPWFFQLTAAVTEATEQQSFFGEEELRANHVEDLLYTTRVEQFFRLGGAFSLLWGVSAQFGPNPTGAGNRTEIYGSDLYLRFRPTGSPTRMAFSLQLEGMFRSRQIPGAVLQDWGGYGQLAWDITPMWQTAIRYDLVSGLEDDDLDPDWTEERQRITLQGTFAPSHFSRIRLQLNYDDPRWLDTPIYAGMLGLEVLVGAHAAHPL